MVTLCWELSKKSLRGLIATICSLCNKNEQSVAKKLAEINERSGGLVDHKEFFEIIDSTYWPYSKNTEKVEQ